MEMPDSLNAFPANTGVNFVPTERNDIYDAINPAATKSLAQPGKVALITGAGRGIGRAIAIQYAHANVAAIFAVSRTTKELESLAKEIAGINSSVRVHINSVDVTDETAVANLAQEVKDKEGRLDILVNNAGWSHDFMAFHDTKPSEWWATQEINVKGTYLFTHAFLPLLLKTAETYKQKVHVIAISSLAALLVNPYLASYQISKAAALFLSEHLQSGYGDKGIVAVAVHPGSVPTVLSANVPDVMKKFMIDTPELCGGFTAWLTAEDGREWLGGRYASTAWDVKELAGRKGDIVGKDLLKLRMTV